MCFHSLDEIRSFERYVKQDKDNQQIKFWLVARGPRGGLVGAMPVFEESHVAPLLRDMKVWHPGAVMGKETLNAERLKPLLELITTPPSAGRAHPGVTISGHTRFNAAEVKRYYAAVA